MAERFTLGVSEKGLGLTDNITEEQYYEIDGTTLIRLSELLNRLYEENERLRNKSNRWHKDWDKMWELCREHMTDEEIIKELNR